MFTSAATAWALGSLLLATPQGGGTGEVRAVGVDENGWPIYESVSATPEKPAGVTPLSEDPTMGGVTPAAPPGGGARPATDRDGLRRGAQPGAVGLESPLRDVFARIGQPADIHDLGGVLAWYRFVIRDHRGGELARREVTHEADLRYPDRDRLLLPGRKVYGREGSAVFAQLHRMPMPAFEADAASELDLFGLLLRAPWCFADDTRFRVHEADFKTVGRDRFLRIQIEALPDPNAAPPQPHSSGATNPPPTDQPSATTTSGTRLAALDQVTDRFELLCDPRTFDPIELHFTLASTRQTRRLILSQYQRVGGIVRMPMKRVLVDEAGSPTLEWSLLRVDHGQIFARSQFRPLTR